LREAATAASVNGATHRAALVEKIESALGRIDRVVLKRDIHRDAVLLSQEIREHLVQIGKR
jgi:hypothetical protein